MPSPQEVEIKFLVPNMKALEAMLRELGFREETPATREINTLYDLPGQKLRRKGELLRLRQYGDTWKLTHKAKRKPGRHKSRAELETGVDNGKQMDAILRALGFDATFVYEKYRAEWSDDQGAVVLDHTPIGDIAEIEGRSRWIDRIARELGVKSQDYITKSYSELFFEWKRKTGSRAENMTFRECGKGTPTLQPAGAAEGWQSRQSGLRRSGKINARVAEVMNLSDSSQETKRARLTRA